MSVSTPPPTCHECGNVFSLTGVRGKPKPYTMTAEGPLCRNRPECRGRVLSKMYEARGLKRWGRETQEQLLAVMDLPPKDWDRNKKWESVHLPHERVLAAIKFFSTCWPVCLLYAVQVDADGEPIREFGKWKRHTHRSLAVVLHMEQSQVTRSISWLKARFLVIELEDRLHPELSPKLLNLQERDACKRINDFNGINDLRALPRKSLMLLAEAKAVLPVDVYTRINAVALDACTRLNAAISDARTAASKAVFDACQEHASLLSRLGDLNTKNGGSSRSRSGNGSHTQNRAGDGDGGSPVKELYTDELIDVDDDEFERRIDASWDEHHARQDRDERKREGSRPSDPDIPPDKLQAAGLGKGAMAKLPSPRPSIEDQPALLVARELQMDDDAAYLLVSRCQAVEPTITGPEIVHLTRSKLEHVKVKIRNGKIDNITGFVIEAVPKMCKGEPLRLARELLEEERQERAQRIAYAREAWPELNEEERADVLQKYPELAELGTQA